MRAYHAWVVGVAVEVLAELNRAIKETKDIPHLAHGANWLQSRWWGLDRHKIADGLLSEDPEDLQDRLLATTLRRSTGRCYWAYIGGHRKGRYGHVQFPGLDRSYHTMCVEEDEVAMEGYGTLAAGGTPIYTGTSHIYYDPGAVPHIRRPFALARREAALFNSAEPIEFLAMPVSGQTALWYRPGIEPMPYQAYYKGAFDLFAEARVQITPLYEDQCDPERLRRFRAVLLPNFACMSDEQADVFRAYVAEGGYLLATHETSLYRPDGSRRDDFALADVFGVHAGLRGLVDLTDLGLRVTSEHPVTRGFAPGRVIPQDFQVLDVGAEDQKQVLGLHYQRDGVGELGPALLARSFGQGKVVYVASGLEAIYWAARFSVIRQLFTSAVEWFAGEARPCRVEAPLGVMTNLMRVHDGLVLHLLNDNGNKNRHVYARQQYVPVQDVQVSIRIPPGRQVQAVRLLEAQQPAVVTRDGDWLRLELPQLGMYEGVHVRLAPGPG